MGTISPRLVPFFRQRYKVTTDRGELKSSKIIFPGWKNRASNRRRIILDVVFARRDRVRKVLLEGTRVRGGSEYDPRGRLVCGAIFARRSTCRSLRYDGERFRELICMASNLRLDENATLEHSNRL